MATGAALGKAEKGLCLSALARSVWLFSFLLDLASYQLAQRLSIYLTARAHGYRYDPGPVTSTRCKMPRHAQQASRDEIVQAGPRLHTLAIARAAVVVALRWPYGAQVISCE